MDKRRIAPFYGGQKVVGSDHVHPGSRIKAGHPYTIKVCKSSMNPANGLGPFWYVSVEEFPDNEWIGPHLFSACPFSDITYFGTDLLQAGHFMWEIPPHGKYLGKGSINFKSLPFHPETFVDNLPFGAVRWHTIEDYSICAICGSCSDDRGGTRSVFWIKETISNEELKERILAVPVLKEIIEKMPFKIDW